MAVGLSIKVVGTLIELILPYILSYILKSVVQKEEVGLIVFWGGVMIVCAALLASAISVQTGWHHL